MFDFCPQNWILPRLCCLKCTQNQLTVQVYTKPVYCTSVYKSACKLVRISLNKLNVDILKMKAEIQFWGQKHTQTDTLPFALLELLLRIRSWHCCKRTVKNSKTSPSPVHFVNLVLLRLIATISLLYIQLSLWPGARVYHYHDLALCISYTDTDMGTLT